MVPGDTPDDGLAIYDDSDHEDNKKALKIAKKKRTLKSKSLRPQIVQMKTKKKVAASVISQDTQYR